TPADPCDPNPNPSAAACSFARPPRRLRDDSTYRCKFTKKSAGADASDTSRPWLVVDLDGAAPRRDGDPDLVPPSDEVHTRVADAARFVAVHGEPANDLVFTLVEHASRRRLRRRRPRTSPR